MARSPGQSLTQLADGRWLLLGGLQNKQTQASASILDARTGQPAPAGAMLEPRAGHTASLLPDGRVLVIGGEGPNGILVAAAERYTVGAGFESMGSLGLLARAWHTATLLADGRLLITGGIDAKGTAIYEAEILNTTTLQVERFNAKLETARLNHLAALIPAGTVLVWGGVNTARQPLETGEVYDPATQRFSLITAQQAAQAAATLNTPAAPQVLAALPADKSSNVPVDQRFAVRLSKAMAVDTLNASTVTLMGPSGLTKANVVAAERGLLLFVTPQQQLLPASTYTLFIQGATDLSGRALPFTALSFTTGALGSAGGASSAGGGLAGTGRAAGTVGAGVGQPTTPAPVQAALPAGAQDDELWIPTAAQRKGEWFSGREGRALDALPTSAALKSAIHPNIDIDPKRSRWADIHSRVQTQLNSMAQERGSLKTLMADGAQPHGQKIYAAKATGDAGAAGTTLTGQALRLNGRPLANVTLRVGNQTARTDANGEFILAGLPAGEQVLTIDGRSANRRDATYGIYQYRTSLQAGKVNALPFVIWMGKLDTANTIKIASPIQKDTVITNPHIPGLELVLPAGSVLRDLEGKIVTEVNITPVPVDQPAFPMPYFGVPVYFTLQPGGTRIESVDGKPKAAILKYPNYTPFGPGQQVSLFDYDPQGRGWYVYAGGKVSADGQAIATTQGFQIYQFSATSVSSGGPNPDDAPPDSCSHAGNDPDSGGGGGWGQDADSGDGPCDGDPVNLVVGEFQHIERDLYVPDVMAIDIKRVFRSKDKKFTSPGVAQDSVMRSFGFGFTSVYEMYLVLGLNASPARISLILADGKWTRFEGLGDGTYRNGSDSGIFFGSYFVNNGTDFVLYLRDGRKWGFSKYQARLKWMEDRAGNRMEILREGNGWISRINSPNGRYVNFTFNAAGRVATATDNLGRSFTYEYDANNERLIKVTDPAGGTRQYAWGGSSNNLLLSITDPKGKVLVRNEYYPFAAPPALVFSSGSASSGGSGSGSGAGGLIAPIINSETQLTQAAAALLSERIKKQTLADGSTFEFTYQENSVNGYIAQVEVVDRRGNTRRAEFDFAGRLKKNTFPVGKAEEQVAVYTYDLASGRVSSRTDSLSRRTDYTYDNLGNVLTITRLAGTAQANTTTFTWNQNFTKPLTIRDANSNTTSFTYDQYGNLTRITDALNKSWNITYDAQGKPVTLKDPLNNTTTLAYDGADLSSVTDPLNRVSRMFTDAVGRVKNVTDPLNNRSYSEYDALNRLTKITDALGGVIRFSYDANGNLLTHTDQANRSTTYTYTDTGQVATKRDALNQLETFVYEPGGKLARHTDRKGQVAGVSYDGHGRVTRVGFGATTANPTAFSSVIDLTWDKANRLTVIADKTCASPVTQLNCASPTVTHTISRVYDDLDRLIKEVSPQGQVVYTYDAGGRRTSMTVANGNTAGGTNTNATVGAGGLTAQPTVSYTWDAANRLTQIRQAAGATNGNVQQTIGYTYDAADRLSRTTLANGITVDAVYDAASQLTSLTYKRPDGTLLGDLTYAYDAAGRRTRQGGSLATATNPVLGKLPAGVDITSASYDANHRLTTWNGQAYSYDANGNLTNDGARSYTWNARNQLQSIAPVNASGVPASSFAYDPLGRRAGKTIGASTTGFLYDGANFVQELSEANTAQAGTDANQANLIANLLTAGIDQTLLRQRLTASGTSITSSTPEHLLRDANNNTLGITNAATTPGLTTRYDYDAYGNVTQSTVSGTASDNSQQYTGRENDQTGLMHYRARYYLPGCARFISEDPIGWASGQTNNYAYVGGNPVSLIDPEGLRQCGGGGRGGGGETQYSVGISGSIGGWPFGPAPFIGGGTSIGITSSGSVFVQFQATGSVGIGLFAGVGVQGGVSRSNTPLDAGLSVSRSAQADFNVGTGPSIGGSVQGNASEGSIGIQGPIPGTGRAGVGIGVQVSGGITQSATFASPALFPSGGCR